MSDVELVLCGPNPVASSFGACVVAVDGLLVMVVRLVVPEKVEILHHHLFLCF